MQSGVARPPSLRATAALGGLHGQRGGQPRPPSADVRLVRGEGVVLKCERGTRPLLQRLTLQPEPGVLDGASYWQGQFLVELANVYDEPERSTLLEVNLGGRMTVACVLAGLGQHIRQRSKYGALMEEPEVLAIFEPTARKTREPRRRVALGGFFGDVYASLSG